MRVLPHFLGPYSFILHSKGIIYHPPRQVGTTAIRVHRTPIGTRTQIYSLGENCSILLNYKNKLMPISILILTAKLPMVII